MLNIKLFPYLLIVRFIQISISQHCTSRISLLNTSLCRTKLSQVRTAHPSVVCLLLFSVDFSFLSLLYRKQDNNNIFIFKCSTMANLFTRRHFRPSTRAVFIRSPQSNNGVPQYFTPTTFSVSNPTEQKQQTTYLSDNLGNAFR